MKRKKREKIGSTNSEAKNHNLDDYIEELEQEGIV